MAPKYPSRWNCSPLCLALRWGQESVSALVSWKNSCWGLSPPSSPSPARNEFPRTHALSDLASTRFINKWERGLNLTNDPCQKMHCMFPQPSAWGWRLGFVPTRAQQVPPTSLARFLFRGCDCEGRKELHGRSFLNRTSVYITERTSIVSVSFSWENSQVVVKRTIL